MDEDTNVVARKLDDVYASRTAESVGACLSREATNRDGR